MSTFFEEDEPLDLWFLQELTKEIMWLLRGNKTILKGNIRSFLETMKYALEPWRILVRTIWAVLETHASDSDDTTAEVICGQICRQFRHEDGRDAFETVIKTSFPILFPSHYRQDMNLHHGPLVSGLCVTSKHGEALSHCILTWHFQNAVGLGDMTAETATLEKILLVVISTCSKYTVADFEFHKQDEQGISRAVIERERLLGVANAAVIKAWRAVLEHDLVSEILSPLYSVTKRQFAPGLLKTNLKSGGSSRQQKDVSESGEIIKKARKRTASKLVSKPLELVLRLFAICAEKSDDFLTTELRNLIPISGVIPVSDQPPKAILAVAVQQLGIVSELLPLFTSWLEFDLEQCPLGSLTSDEAIEPSLVTQLESLVSKNACLSSVWQQWNESLVKPSKRKRKAKPQPLKTTLHPSVLPTSVFAISSSSTSSKQPTILDLLGYD
jgi:hypothetical protein